MLQLYAMISINDIKLVIKVNVYNLGLLSQKDGSIKNFSSSSTTSPSCTLHSHCVYEHVSGTDTDDGGYEVINVKNNNTDINLNVIIKNVAQTCNWHFKHQ